MSVFFARQAGVLRQLLSDYRDGLLSLNSLVQRIEGVGAVIESDVWTDAVFPLVLSMEEINAVALDENRSLTATEKAMIDSSLLELEAVINRLE